MNAHPAPVQQRRVSRREVLTGILMASAAAVAAARKPNIKLDYLGTHKLDEIVPPRIGRWNLIGNSGLVVPPEDQLQLAIYSQLLTRVYSDGANAIMVLVAYSASETGFLQIHRPEFCYTAAGYTLSDFAPHPIALGPSTAIPTNGLTATRDGMREKLFYWTRIGDHIPRSWAQQKLTVAGDNLKRLIPDAALIRVSMVTVDEASATAMIDDFVRAMITSVPPALRRVFVA